MANAYHTAFPSKVRPPLTTTTTTRETVQQCYTRQNRSSGQIDDTGMKQEQETPVHNLMRHLCNSRHLPYVTSILALVLAYFSEIHLQPLAYHSVS